MEEKEIKLVPEKEKKEKKNILNKIMGLFEDKEKRYLYLGLFVLPFVIAIGIFGFVAFKDAKDLISLLKGQAVVNEENMIRSMNYVLRDNATDIQKEYFAELKQGVEEGTLNDESLAGLICKNYVADLYTWTNKQGQYDVSALYYVYTPQKEVIYTQCRDSFYKYLNNYINDYGSKNLIEVESVTVTKSNKLGYDYVTAAEETFDDAVYVTCNWTYKAGSKMNTNDYATSMNFIVVIRDGRAEIAEASEKEINARQEVEEVVEEVEVDENED